MSSSLLHQAVELAQTGQREQARQLFLQFLQDEPNNEVAWLWVASVASDQIEYMRALNEVLRINPENPRARSLLDEYHRQHVPPAEESPPDSEAQFTRPSGPPASPPSDAPAALPYAPPAADQWVPPASESLPPQEYAPQSYAPPPQQGQAQMPPVQQPPVIIERERVVEKRRGRGCLGCGPGCLGLGSFGCGGCGCGQGCLLALVILVVIPMIACGALSYSTRSLGPFDLVLGMLPGEFGRKNVEIHSLDYSDVQGQSFTVTASVPRGWLLIDPDDSVWKTLAEMTDQAFPFAQESRSWKDEALAANQHPIFLDMNFAYLSEAGNLIKLELAGQPESGDYSCQTVESLPDVQVYTYDDNLCGYRVDQVLAYAGGAVFKDVDPPAQMRTVTFYTPATDTLALRWTLTLPEDTSYDRYKDHIDALIESVTINQ